MNYIKKSKESGCNYDIIYMLLLARGDNYGEKEEKKEESPTNLANEYLALYQKTDAALEEWEKMHRRLADYFQQIR